MKYGDLETFSITQLKGGHLAWTCLCRCGNTKIIRSEHLRSGASTSCGLCDYKGKYPLAHKSWDSMHQRCDNPNAPDYLHYGGRGIKICIEWLRFIDFFDDMGNPPTDVLTGNRCTLERKNVNGDYNKNNCTWATIKEQNINKTNTLHKGIFRYSNGNRRLRVPY